MTAFWIALGSCAWISATFVPIYLSVLSQRRANQAQSRWLVHLLFAPTVLAVAWVSAFFLTLADGDQDRAADERGLGILLLPAMLILVGVLVHYYGKLAFRLLKRTPSQQTDGS